MPIAMAIANTYEMPVPLAFASVVPELQVPAVAMTIMPSIFIPSPLPKPLPAL